MGLKATVIGYTHDVEESIGEYRLEDLTGLSGKVAGICYGSGEYFNTYITDPVKAQKRFNMVVKSGHHSISDHASVTVLFEGIPKMVAMVLNSLQVYATSERSGRYTEMAGSDEREVELYNKWKKIFQSLIAHQYPQFDEKHVEKLSMENARYFLSVFTPTTMAYTTSLRQWNYIIDWCDDFLRRDKSETYLNYKLSDGIQELKSNLMDILYVPELRDSKNRNFGFLSIQVGDYSDDFWDNGVFLDMFKTAYVISLAGLGQVQRHRTLKYRMHFDGSKGMSFYVPYILRGHEDFSDEWISDMETVRDLIPQATMVPVEESGHVEDFLMKCQERICSRVQLEVSKNTEETLTMINRFRGFVLSDYDLVKECITERISGLMDQYVIGGVVCPKCVIQGGCKEPCILGGSYAVNRLI